ncbi:hypothetical protein JZ751_011895 [Albula glossodonta]|uniref:Uncharacterized protein n=1 Tax=Albula glossodonta TaxID=121402 RepID=A0A8T2PQW0_9TELE|nr:hypothetical protein JZ751_011895 [Albula glossodonta]
MSQTLCAGSCFELCQLLDRGFVCVDGPHRLALNPDCVTVKCYWQAQGQHMMAYSVARGGKAQVTGFSWSPGVFHWHACDRMKPLSHAPHPCAQGGRVRMLPIPRRNLSTLSHPTDVQPLVKRPPPPPLAPRSWPVWVRAGSCEDGQAPGVEAGGQNTSVVQLTTEGDRSRPRQVGGHSHGLCAVLS